MHWAVCGLLFLISLHEVLALPASFQTPRGALSYPSPLPSRMRFGERPALIDADPSPEMCGNSLCVHGICKDMSYGHE